MKNHRPKTWWMCLNPYDKAAQRIAHLERDLRAARTRCQLLARERNALKSQISNLKSPTP